jgi:hypothetical protein
MSRTAYDSVTWQHNPARRDEIAFLYGDGRFAAPADAVTHFRDLGAQVVRITVLGDPQWGVCDVERGDVTPARSRDYVRARHALGHLPTIYCSRAAIPAVRASCAGLAYDIWAADWTGEPHEVEGTVGTQYLPGAEYDTSRFYDDGWHARASA